MRLADLGSPRGNTPWMIDEEGGRCFDDAVRDGILAYAEGSEGSVWGAGVL